MTRRAFLPTLIAGMMLDPERLLWRPGAKLISLPAPRRPIRIPFQPLIGGQFRVVNFDCLFPPGGMAESWIVASSQLKHSH